VIEKALNLFSKDDEGQQPAQDADTQTDDTQTDGTEKDSDAVYYQGIVSSIAQDLEDIGEVFYSEELNYSTVIEPAYESVTGADTFVDEDWYENESGNKVTYAEAAYQAVLDHYKNWSANNSDSTLVGINTLELGEIVKTDEGYYVLTRVTYMTDTGEPEIKTQTCFMTEGDNSMFIEEIKEETING
jgi:hypothetical protein